MKVVQQGERLRLGVDAPIDESDAREGRSGGAASLDLLLEVPLLPPPRVRAEAVCAFPTCTAQTNSKPVSNKEGCKCSHRSSGDDSAHRDAGAPYVPSAKSLEMAFAAPSRGMKRFEIVMS